MTTTKALYDDRKDEIEFYYQILFDVMNYRADEDDDNSDEFRSVINIY